MAERFPYEDIVDLPHHVSKKHPQPTMADRAARFAPFAAITGYEEMVLEEARITDDRIELDENSKAALNEKLNMILEFIDEQPEVSITYFEPDKRKAGGAYRTVTGQVRKFMEYERTLLLHDGTLVPFDCIYELMVR